MTQMKLSSMRCGAPSCIKSLFIALFITSVPVLADTLVVGTVYFDSAQTLHEVIKLSAQADNNGIAKLIENGHISHQTGDELDIVVLASGSTPESPAEFRFLNGPTTYWTLTRNVTHLAKPIPTSTPLSTPTGVPAASLTLTSKRHQRQHASNAPFDNNGWRISHQVDDKWKRYPVNGDDHAKSHDESTDLQRFAFDFVRSGQTGSVADQHRFYADSVHFYGEGDLSWAGVAAAIRRYHKEKQNMRYETAAAAGVKGPVDGGFYVVDQPVSWSRMDGSRLTRGRSMLHLRVVSTGRGIWKITSIEEVGQ
jgi:hypothetical protein